MIPPSHLRRLAHQNGVRRPPKRLGRQQQPDGIRVSYFGRILRGPLADLRQLVDHYLIPELPSLAAEAQGNKLAKNDAATDRLSSILDDIRKRYGERWTNERFAELVRVPAAELDRFQARQLNDQLRKVFGVDVVGNEGWLRDALSTFVGENVSLIKHLAPDTLSEIEKRTSRALADGGRAETLQKDIEDRLGVSESRAKLIARDQIGKLNGDLNQARQRDLGIESYIWRGMRDNRERQEHVDREGNTYRWDDPPGDPPTDPATGGNPGEAINCVPGSSFIESDAGVIRFYRREYAGELTELVSANGEVLSTTPNHPILTREGWKPAKSIEVGDQLVKIRQQVGQGLIFDQNHAKTSAVQLFNAFEDLYGLSPSDMPAGGFHGDGTKQQVHIVNMEGGLRVELPAAFDKLGLQNAFALADYSASCRSPFQIAFKASLRSAHRGVRGACEIASFLLRQKRVTQEHRFASRAGLQALADHFGANGCATYAEICREFLNAESPSPALAHELAIIVFGIARRSIVEPSSLQPDRPELDAQGVRIASELCGGFGEGAPALHEFVSVREKRGRVFSGQVFNLETGNARFVADGFTVHNCRCYGEPDLSAILAGNQDSAIARRDFVEKVSGGYRVISHQTGKNFGTYPTKEAAEKRLAQIHRFHHG